MKRWLEKNEEAIEEFIFIIMGGVFILAFIGFLVYMGEMITDPGKNNLAIVLGAAIGGSALGLALWKKLEKHRNKE